MEGGRNERRDASVRLRNEACASFSEGREGLYQTEVGYTSSIRVQCPSLSPSSNKRVVGFCACGCLQVYWGKDKVYYKGVVAEYTT